MRSPVWPIWSACGRQPRFVTTREPPTAPPRASASCCSTANPSALPTPRPPPTTTFASPSEIVPAAGSSRRTTRTRTSSSVSSGTNDSTASSPGSAATACGATVSSLTAPLSVASSSRLPPQRCRTTVVGSPSSRGDDVRGERQVEPRRDVRHHLGAAVARGGDDGFRGVLLDELNDPGSPGRRRVRLTGVDRERPHVAEPAGERQRLTGELPRLDETEDHATPSSRSTSTTRGAAAAPSPSTTTGVDSSCGTDSRTFARPPSRAHRRRRLDLRLLRLQPPREGGVARQVDPLAHGDHRRQRASRRSPSRRRPRAAPSRPRRRARCPSRR